MFYAYQVAHGLDPNSVPEFDPSKVADADPYKGTLDICWLHRNTDGQPDLAASKDAAQAMIAPTAQGGYDIVHPPHYPTHHTGRTAIDMRISWTGNLVIQNASHATVSITSNPKTGAGNADLWAVGRTYEVRKLVDDAPHWSADGH